MSEFYSEQDLVRMHIFQLRDAARKIGVSSPTTKNKEELIRMYLDISTGKVKPAAASKRGRPPKQKLDEPAGTASPATERPYVREVKEDAEKRDRKEPVKDVQEKLPVDINDLLKSDDCEKKSGVLDVLAEGYGFLRAENCEYGNKDAYVSAKLIRGMGLRPGDLVTGIAKKNAENRPPAVIAVESVNGKPPENLRQRPQFDNLVPIYPNERFKLERDSARNDFAIRCIDLIAPIGKGQRAMTIIPT